MIILLAALGVTHAAEPVPTVAQSGPGRFEVAAVDATVGHAVIAAAEEAWRMLAVPLALPDSFSSPVFVRIISEGEPTAAPFHVTVEPGGIVSMRMQWSAAPSFVVRRALVQALLMRLAVAQHGVNARLVVPLWLEHACVGLWQTRAEGAQLDALKQESARMPSPPLTALFNWQRGDDEPRALVAGSVWLVTILQSESGRAREWWRLLSQILGGEPVDAALTATFGEKFSNADERELWWQTAWHQTIRARTLPTLEAPDSAAQLAALARFVFAGPTDDGDVVVALSDVLSRASEPIVAAELQRRAAELARLVPALHPFYRNAGLSLATAFTARRGREATRAGLAAVFEADWGDANELAAASAAALDALEKNVGLAVPSRPGL